MQIAPIRQIFGRGNSVKLSLALVSAIWSFAGCSTEKSAASPTSPSAQTGTPSGANANAVAQTTTGPASGAAAGSTGGAQANAAVPTLSSTTGTPPSTLGSPAATSGSTGSSFINSLIAAFGGGGATTSGGSTGSSGVSAANTVLTSAQLDQLRTACLNSINQYRATIGKSALTLNTGEASCLDGQAKGDGAGVVAHAHFGACQEEAQDECPGWDGDPGTQQSACLASMWAEGPGGGHYENMSGNYTSVQCGFAQGTGGWWMVQDFFP